MIHIEDDFFKDPYSVRNIALKSTYTTAHDGSWPGYRCWDIPENITNHILSKVRNFAGDQSLEFDYKQTQQQGSPNSSFQFIPQQYRDGVYHSDYMHHYICIIYLSLESAVNSGTEVCDFDQKKGRGRTNIAHNKKIRFNKDPFNLIKRYNYDRIRKKINSDYKPIMTIPHKFNRAVVFPAGLWHRAQNFFGTSIENGRLTSVSFFGNT